MKEWEAREFIENMSDEQFSEFCKTCTSEQIKVISEMRFFHKLFNNPVFYKEVEEEVGEAIYQELRA